MYQKDRTTCLAGVDLRIDDVKDYSNSPAELKKPAAALELDRYANLAQNAMTQEVRALSSVQILAPRPRSSSAT